MKGKKRQVTSEVYEIELSPTEYYIVKKALMEAGSLTVTHKEFKKAFFALEQQVARSESGPYG